jgi:virulence plasmid B protein
MLSDGQKPHSPTRDASVQQLTATLSANPLSAISLPKGSGAIRGIGEKFAANPVTGTGSMTVPIATSPARSGFGPQLSLSHDSGAGNWPFGVGWTFSLPSIMRRTDKGLPQYRDAEESDVFMLSGAEDLVPLLIKNGAASDPESFPSRTVGNVEYRIHRYRPCIEGLFARIECWTRTSDGDTHWRSISKDNVTTLYRKRETGSDPVQSRIYDQRDHSHLFSWLISESSGDKGNAISYEYKMENSRHAELSPAHECNRTEGTRKANRYLKRIKYGHSTPRQPNEDPSLRKDWRFEVVFDDDEHDTEDNQDHPTSVFLTDDQRHWPIRQDPFSVTASVSRCAREQVVFDRWRHETWNVADTLTLEPPHDDDVKGCFVHPCGTPHLPAAESSNAPVPPRRC